MLCFCCIENRIQNYQGLKNKNRSFVLCAVLTGNSKNESSMLFRVCSEGEAKILTYIQRCISFQYVSNQVIKKMNLSHDTQDRLSPANSMYFNPVTPIVPRPAATLSTLSEYYRAGLETCESPTYGSSCMDFNFRTTLPLPGEEGLSVIEAEEVLSVFIIQYYSRYKSDGGTYLQCSRVKFNNIVRTDTVF